MPEFVHNFDLDFGIADLFHLLFDLEPSSD